MKTPLFLCWIMMIAANVQAQSEAALIQEANRCLDSASSLQFSFPKTAMRYARTAYQKGIRAADSTIISKSVYLQGSVHYEQGVYDSAGTYFRRSLHQMPAGIDINFKSQVYNDIGLVEKRHGVLDSALHYLLKALYLREQNKDTVRMAASHVNISNVLRQLDNHEKALVHLDKAKALYQKSGNAFGEAAVWINTGNIWLEKAAFTEALECYDAALALYNTLESPRNKAKVLNNIGNVYLQQGELSACKSYFEQALALKKQVRDDVSAASTMINLAQCHRKEDALHKSDPYLKEAWEIAINSGDFSMQQRIAAERVLFHEAKHQYKEAFEWQSLHLELNEHVFAIEMAQSVNNLSYQYQTKEQAQNIARLKAANNERIAEINAARLREEHAHFQKNAFLFISILLAAGIAGFYFLYRRVIKTRNQLNQQKKITDKRNREITDSLSYASKIQSSMLPDTHWWDACFNAHFVFYQPKEAIGGDFYWSAKVDQTILFAVGDCTGHGVPGALMSFLGHAYLQEAVNNHGYQSPAKILEFLNVSVNQALGNHHERKLRDGMDILIGAYHTASRKLTFSGAGRPLILIRNLHQPYRPMMAEQYLQELQIKERQLKTSGNETHLLLEISGNKQPVGSYPENRRKPLAEHTLQLQKGDVLYAFSDGFPDQFGTHGEKYMRQHFRRLLLRLRKHPVSQHGVLLQQEWQQWTGTQRQTDDICILGIEI